MPTSKHKLTALLLVLGLAACAQQAAKPVVRPTPTPSPSPVVESPSPDPSPTPSAAPVAQAPSVVVPPPQAGPLPGQTLALSDPLAYPLLIQIENTAPARPQAGIGAASVVFQYLTEGGITRFSALFHRVPGVVGPVRSARFVSVYLFQRFDAILMCSGGAAATYNKIWATNIPSFINDFDHGVHFFRWNGRVAPHNLYTSQAQMLKVADAGYRPPSATDIARSDAWPGTEPATSVSIPDFHSS
ncbi:MAG TPA: DUF3048 domain-containing protein [Candidatus Dormibacteraeota bacterium]|nr:DUF3048 domain-containing protein [Candidatus Dormibacteraeota bacterium]